MGVCAGRGNAGSALQDYYRDANSFHSHKTEIDGRKVIIIVRNVVLARACEQMVEKSSHKSASPQEEK